VNKIRLWVARKIRVQLDLRCPCGEFIPATYELGRVVRRGVAPMACVGCGTRARLSMAVES
jgi:hypothetical protein